MRPIAKLAQAAEVLLSETLLFRTRQSINAWIRGQLRQAAYSEIDRVAAFNVSKSKTEGFERLVLNCRLFSEILAGEWHEVRVVTTDVGAVSAQMKQSATSRYAE